MKTTKRFGTLLGLSLLLASCGQPTAPVAPENGAPVKPTNHSQKEGFSTSPEKQSIENDVIEGEYVVVLKEGARLGGISAQSIGDTQLTAQSLETGLGLNPQGLEIQKVYNSALKGFAGKLTPQHIEALSKNEAVDYIEKNVVIRGSQAQRTESGLWGLDRIDQRSGRLDGSFEAGATGKGVVAYILDTGIRTSHSEFGGRAFWGGNTVDNYNVDCHSHGTHVAGTVGGKTYGVAKEATLVAVKVLNCDNSGSLASIAGGLDWIRENHNRSQFRGRPAVINMSINARGRTFRAYDDAVRAVTRTGIAVVNSAGNQNENACNHGPANNAEAIVVGSIDRYNNRSDFSNWGRCLDIFAPGSDVKSAGFDGDNRWMVMSGTSMAAPHVTGAAALLLQRNPKMTPAQLEARLIADSTKNAINNVGPGSPNRLLFVDPSADASGHDDGDRNVAPAPAPTPAPAPVLPTLHTGQLNQGYRGYVHQGGKIHRGKLQVQISGPEGTDFDLYLQRYDHSGWSTVASSTGATSSESLSYNTDGYYYRIVVYSDRGNGTIQIRTNGW